MGLVVILQPEQLESHWNRYDSRETGLRDEQFWVVGYSLMESNPSPDNLKQLLPTKDEEQFPQSIVKVESARVKTMIRAAIITTFINLFYDNKSALLLTKGTTNLIHEILINTYLYHKSNGNAIKYN